MGKPLLYRSTQLCLSLFFLDIAYDGPGHSFVLWSIISCIIPSHIIAIYAFLCSPFILPCPANYAWCSYFVSTWHRSANSSLILQLFCVCTSLSIILRFLCQWLFCMCISCIWQAWRYLMATEAKEITLAESSWTDLESILTLSMVLLNVLVLSASAIWATLGVGYFSLYLHNGCIKKTWHHYADLRLSLVL